MAERVIVTIHLPLEMGAVGRIMRAVAREFPDATVANMDGGFGLRADDDPRLTVGARRRIARDRSRAAQEASHAEAT